MFRMTEADRPKTMLSEEVRSWEKGQTGVFSDSNIVLYQAGHAVLVAEGPFFPLQVNKSYKWFWKCHFRVEEQQCCFKCIVPALILAAVRITTTIALFQKRKKKKRKQKKQEQPIWWFDSCSCKPLLNLEDNKTGHSQSVPLLTGETIQTRQSTQTVSSFSSVVCSHVCGWEQWVNHAFSVLYLFSGTTFRTIRTHC